MKTIIGFALGIMLASATAQDKSYIGSVPTITTSSGMDVVQTGPSKVMAHLDSDELAAIKEACK